MKDSEAHQRASDLCLLEHSRTLDPGVSSCAFLNAPVASAFCPVYQLSLQRQAPILVQQKKVGIAPRAAFQPEAGHRQLVSMARRTG
jgi:hypothetical protein